jgi:para-aminobenzoate synthetase/4-amino-4-deoxychorismate lyase
MIGVSHDDCLICLHSFQSLHSQFPWYKDFGLVSLPRAQYDNAWRTAEAKGAFDMLFQNIDEELTEGARSNVFVKLDGKWYTPRLAAGALPGVMRQVLLSDPRLNASEARITVNDLCRAEQVMVCNAL